MKSTRQSSLSAALLTALAAATPMLTSALASAQAPQPVGTGITYQGKLEQAGAPANGLFDLEFKLYNHPVLGGVIATSTQTGVNVVDGLFSREINFGSSFDGAARWITIGVRPNGSVQAFTLLNGRQELTPAPYAVGVALPYVASYSATAPLFHLVQTGTGDGMQISATGGNALELTTTGGTALNASISGPGTALYGQTTGGNSVFGYNLGQSGNAGLFRTENVANDSATVRVESNGTGDGVHAISRAGHAGLFENTNVANLATTLLVNNASPSLALWSKTTGSGGAGRFEISNQSNSSIALEAKTNGTGLAGRFVGNVDVQGELHATIGTVLNRATPVAFGTFGNNGQLASSSGNVTVTNVNGVWRIFVVGEGDPSLWTVVASVQYPNAGSNNDEFYVLRIGAPVSVAGQPGNGVFYLRDYCVANCDEFQTTHSLTFIVYKGV